MKLVWCVCVQVLFLKLHITAHSSPAILLIFPCHSHCLCIYSVICVYLLTALCSDTLGREFDPGKQDFSH